MKDKKNSFINEPTNEQENESNLHLIGPYLVCYVSTIEIQTHRVKRRAMKLIYVQMYV